MKYKRSETPAYLIWVEQRPTVKGKGREVYYEAVRQAARREIDSPIEADDIEVEITYVTDIHKDIRMDADNVNKPTLDALKGVAYKDDNQVRSVHCAVFDKHHPATVSGRVEQFGPLFYSDKSHVVLIEIYSDTRLAELGGDEEVERRRRVEWERNFGRAISKLKGSSG
jgi:Holliday junction resolvase RusA-like endonuclease